jgi:hypothetical protein
MKSFLKGYGHGVGWGNRFSMDAKRSITTRLPNRHMTGCALRVGSTDAALHLAQIFKKTPYAAGLKPHRRDAAKDMVEIDGVPLPMTTLNVKLTGAGRVERKTKSQARQTNHMWGALVTHPGGAYEKQCYADS